MSDREFKSNLISEVSTGIFSADSMPEEAKAVVRINTVSVPKNLLSRIEPISNQEDNIDVSCW